MRAAPAIGIGALLVALLSCAGPTEGYYRVNPAFPRAPLPGETVAAVPLSPDHFIIVDRDLFTEDLQIYPEEIHPELGEWTNRKLSAVVGKWPGGSDRLLPRPDAQTFAPREPKQVRGTVFLPLSWPWPGEKISFDTGEIPRLIWIPSELTIGPDLRAASLYDYTLAHTYTEEGEVSSRSELTAVAVWTLWDNEVQNYRSYGTTEVRLPIRRPVTREQLDRLYDLLLSEVAAECGILRRGGK